MLLDELYDGNGGRHASQAYWNALNTLRATWREVFDEDLPTIGNRAKAAFEQAIEQVKRRLSSDASGERRLRAALDVDASEDIAEALLHYANMDDLPPRAVKEALREQCLRLGDGRHELRSMLRPALDQLFPDDKTRRPRVGANRHWPRLLQYVRELETDTDWDTGKGVHLLNAGGGGRVAAWPADPADLAVRIDTAHL